VGEREGKGGKVDRKAYLARNEMKNGTLIAIYARIGGEYGTEPRIHRLS
jgi:hypothetical protein